MTVQTTYSAAIQKGYPGLQADNNPVRSVTLICETAVIPFGRAVQPGSSDDLAVLGTTTATSSYSGIAMEDMSRENVSAGVESRQYPVGRPMAIMEEGSIYVELITTGAKGDAIYSVDADGTIGAGTAGAGQTQIPGGVLEETVTAVDQIVKIRLKSE